jgi:hypothetical protein
MPVAVTTVAVVLGLTLAALTGPFAAATLVSAAYLLVAFSREQELTRLRQVSLGW